mgnify:FL=1
MLSLVFATCVSLVGCSGFEGIRSAAATPNSLFEGAAPSADRAFVDEAVRSYDPDDPIIAGWRGEEALRNFEVLRTARVPFDPHPNDGRKRLSRALGARLGAHPGTGRNPSRAPLVEAVVDLRQGVEVQILSLTFGIDLWPPAHPEPIAEGGLAHSSLALPST